jgi:hypothetical protein
VVERAGKAGWKRLTSNLGALPTRQIILPRRLIVSQDMPWFRLRRKKNVQTSAGIATRTATGAASSDATGTAIGAASNDATGSLTAADGPCKAIPEVNEVGCTVVYEGEGPLRAEYVDIYLTIRPETVADPRWLEKYCFRSWTRRPSSENLVRKGCLLAKGSPRARCSKRPDPHIRLRRDCCKSV